MTVFATKINKINRSLIREAHVDEIFEGSKVVAKKRKLVKTVSTRRKGRGYRVKHGMMHLVCVRGEIVG